MFYINNKIIQFKNHVIKSVTNNVNPLNLPSNTIRVKFASGYTPTMGDTQTLVDSTNNVWDIYKQSNDWSGLFNINGNSPFHELLVVLGANTSNVTNMNGLFRYCKSLTSLSLFDTSNVTNMGRMFAFCSRLTSIPLYDTAKVMYIGSMLHGCSSLTTVPLFNTSNVTAMNHMLFGCYSLTTVPLFNTSNVTTMNSMLYGCKNVQSGALALYQQASTQANPPTDHSQTFYMCGSNTQTGKAELAQIPDDWKG